MSLGLWLDAISSLSTCAENSHNIWIHSEIFLPVETSSIAFSTYDVNQLLKTSANDDGGLKNETITWKRASQISNLSG